MTTTVRATRFPARTAIAALLTASALALSGCSDSGASNANDTATTPAAHANGETSPARDVVTVTDAWVKAADEGASAAFGTFGNTGSNDVTVVQATTTASKTVELHETAANDAGEMVMQQVKAGYVIPAGGLLALEPGGSHMMLMDLAAPLKPGDEVTFTVTYSDGSTSTFTAPVKDYSGANESYNGGESGAEPIEPSAEPGEG